MRDDLFIAGAVRTPVGSIGGMLSGAGAAELGAIAVKAALVRAGVEGKSVDEVYFGNVIGAGLGQNVARQVSIGAGVPTSVGATTVNKVCGSGLKAVMLGGAGVRLGECGVVVCGGTESMSRAPYLLEKARGGYRMGDGVLVDAMIRDGLWDVYNNVHMGTCGDACARKYSFTRAEQDEFSAESYRRAREAAASGAFGEEIVGVETTVGKSKVLIDKDEQPGRFDFEKMKILKPAFGVDGTITAGNASGISDGAAAVVVLSGEKVLELGVKPMGKILGSAGFAGAPEWFTTAPIGAIGRLLERVGWKVSEVDLFEINEAFAVVAMAAMKDLGIEHKRLNVNGGAVAIGHPIGASGARVLVTLLHALRRRGLKRGVASLCIGGGEAVAMAVEAAG